MRTLSSSTCRWALTLLTAGAFVFAAQQSASAVSGTWSEPTGDGLWTNSANWQNGNVADGAGNTANFTAVNVDAAAVGAMFAPFYRNAARLEAPQTIGNLTFGDSNPATPGGWEIYPNVITTDVLTLAGTTPTVTVSLLGPINTATLGASPGEVIDDALISANLAAANGFTKTGPGVLTLGGGINDGLHGTVMVNQGTLRVRAGATFDYETAVDPERTQFHLANGTVLEAGATVGDPQATGAGISIEPGATVTLRKLGAPSVSFANVGGAGATVNVEAAEGLTGFAQDWAAGGALAAVNLKGTTPGTPSVFQLRNNGSTTLGTAFFTNSFATTPVTMTNAVLSTRTNSFGNVNEIGSLTGDATSRLEGGSSDSGTFVSYQIGGLNTNTSFAGTITNVNGLNLFKVGSGKLTLSGTLTYTTTTNAAANLRGGITRVMAGTLALTGGAAIPGGVADATLGNLFTTIDIKSGATLDVSGTTTTYSTAALQQVIGSGTVVGNYNHAQGRLRPGDVTFGDSNSTTATAGKLTFANSLNISGGTINYDLAPAGVVGDYNGNNSVDAADYTVWRDSLGTNAVLPNRASGNSGAVNQDDYIAWKNNFGQTSAGGGELIQVGGGALSGNAIVDVGVLPGATAGTYTVINSATPLTGSIAGWTVNWTGRGTTPTLVQTANQVQLNASSLIPPATVNWRGDQPGGVWDAGTAGTANWQNTTTNAADKFFTRDTAQFLDTYNGATAPTTTTVALNSTVSPGAVVVNSSLNYTISGTGRISGIASFKKQGIGRLSIPTNNDFSGGSTISGGVVDLEATGVLGTREITFAGGQLHAGVSGNFNLNNDLVVTGTGSVLSNDNNNRQTLNVNGRISGNGNLFLANDAGAGTMALALQNGIDFFGDNSAFTGSVTFGDLGIPTEQGSVFLRFRTASSQGSKVAWDIGNNGSVLSQRVDVATPTTFVLGSLAGGPLSGVQGFGSGANPGGASIWQIGSLNTSTEFAGVIANGNVGSNAAKFSAVTKVGTGTLTLSGANTYTGDTRIEGGVLRTTAATVLPDATAITLLAGATLNLDFSGTDTIRGLVIPGATQAIGVWGSLSSSATFKSSFLTGGGLLNVTSVITPGAGSLAFGAVPEPASVMLVVMSMGMFAAARSPRRS